MSIIQEALKKAQTTYVKETVKAVSPQKSDIGVESAAQKSHGAAAPYVKLMPGVILLVILAGLGLNSFSSKNTAGTAKGGPYHDVSYKLAIENAAMTGSSDAGFGIQTQVLASPIKSAISSGAAFVNAPDLELNGIMYLEERPRAIINGNMVEVGESVNGARINAITNSSVLLNYNDLDITLKLKE